MKLLSGFQLSNGYTLAITRAIGWSSFDVEITGADLVQRCRLHRTALTIVLQDFKKRGVMRIKNVELSVPSIVERTQLLEQAEAILREELV